MLTQIKSALINFIQSYLTILIISALGLFTYWQTLYLNKNQPIFNPADLSKSHTPLYELQNADFIQYQKSNTITQTTKDQQSYEGVQSHIRAKTALQYADDRNFELKSPEFEKTFFKNLQKQSQLSISSQVAKLDANFNQLQLQEKVLINRTTAVNRLLINAQQANLKLREDVISFGKINAQYKNLKTSAQHQFTAEKAIWNEQKQRLDAQMVKIHFENPQAVK